MGGQQGIVKKSSKLTIRADSTLNLVNQKLNISQQINERKINLLACSNIATIFSKIKNALFIQQNRLKILEIVFQSIKNLTFQETLYKLSDLQQLTELSITFTGHLFWFSNIQTQSLSSCLCMYHRLTILKINVHIDCIDAINDLSEFYKLNSSLKSIQFFFKDSTTRENKLRQFFIGLRYSRNLESFSLKIYNYFLRVSQILDILVDELIQINSLKNLVLHFGRCCYFTLKDSAKLSGMLRRFQNLETLYIQAESLKQLENITELGKYFQQTTALQELSLALVIEMNYSHLLEKIALIPHLKKVNLDLGIKYLTSIESNPIQFGQMLAKQQNLIILRLDFIFYLPIEDVFMLLVQLKPNLKLKQLKVRFYASTTEEEEPNPQLFSDFVEIVGRLERFAFELSTTKITKKQEILIKTIITSLKEAQNLEHIEFEIRNPTDNRFETQQFSLQDMLKNKAKLRSIHFNTRLFLLQDQSHSLQLENLKQKQKLTDIVLNFQVNLDCNEIFLKKFAESLCSLTQLTTLDIKFGNKSQFSDEGFSFFSDNLKNLSQLKSFKINLDKDKISLGTLNNFISSLKQLKKVKTLELEVTGQQFKNDEEEKRFGDCFKLPSKLVNLTIILEINCLKYKNMKNLIENISSLNRIETLDFFVSLDECYYLEECKEIYHSLSKLKNLHTLIFSPQSLPLIYLMSLIGQLDNISTITRDYNDECAEKKLVYEVQIDNSIKLVEQTSLALISDELFSNEVYEKENAALIIPFLFQNLSFLDVLYLSFQKDDQIGIDFLSSVFLNLSLLQRLSKLSIIIKQNNQIGLRNVEQLGKSLASLKQLKTLLIDINFFKNTFSHFSLSFGLLLGNLYSLQNQQQLTIDCYLETRKQDISREKENRETIIQLFESLSQLIQIKMLKVKISNLVINKEIFIKLNTMCNQLNQNLIMLELYTFDIEQSDQKKFNDSFNKFQKLQVLKTNLGLKKTLKLPRLVVYERIYVRY